MWKTIDVPEHISSRIRDCHWYLINEVKVPTSAVTVAYRPQDLGLWVFFADEAKPYITPAVEKTLKEKGFGFHPFLDR